VELDADEEEVVEVAKLLSLLMDSSAGSMNSSLASCRSSGAPTTVNHRGMPGATFTMSASEISARTVITSSWPRMTMVGADWEAFTVWPSWATRASTVPSMGAVMRV